MSFSEISKKEAVRIIEAKIKGEEHCHSSIVNEAIRMIKDEREMVEQQQKEIEHLKFVMRKYDKYANLSFAKRYGIKL